MYTRKILLFLLILPAFVTQVCSQSREATMTFKSESHDFGKLKEQDGDARFSFVFQNTGAKPIVITNVKSTCGCTTPNWTRKPVNGGEEGKIDVVYHAKGRPGNFHKSIIVYSNAQNSPVTLKISGTVVPKPKGIEDEYRYLIDKLRFKKTNIHFSNLYNDETRTETVEFVNVSDEAVKIEQTDKRRQPPHIQISISPENVEPGQKGSITVVYDAKQKDDWDYVRDNIMFNINGEYDARYRITVSAHIKERFSEEDLKNPPAITFITPQVYEFGTITKGEKIEHSFKFKNTGKSDLIIRKVRASCGCTATTTGKTVLKPGEEGVVNATFNSSHKNGAQRNTITMITNIPGQTNRQDNARIIFTMKGHVQTSE